MPKSCIVPGCFEEPNCSVFRAPKNIARREKWSKAVRSVFPNLDVGENFCVCEKHFRKVDFTSCIADEFGNIVQEEAVKRKRLRHEAVPYFEMLNMDQCCHSSEESCSVKNERDFSS